MNIDDKMFTLSNGRKYMVLESLNYEGKQYAYFSNVDNEMDTMFVEINLENGIKINKIEENLLKETIFPLFVKKFESYED